jgi:hypothetical protein
MNITKALIIKKEWLHLIFENKKTVEIRSSNTNIRGRIALIESKSSLILGECILSDSFQVNDLNIESVLKNSCLKSKSEIFSMYSKPYAWKLENTIKYENPIKYNHPKGAIIWIDIQKQNIILQ